MSYSDNVDLEAQIPYTDSPEFENLSENLASSLFEINSNIASLENILKSLDNQPTTNDNSKEERAVSLAENTRQKFRSISDSIKTLQTWPDSLPSQKFTQQKLSREFSSAFSEFQAVQRELAQKQRTSIIRAKTTLAQEELEGNTALHEEDESQAQEQIVRENLRQADIDYQTNLIQEREAEIEGIEHGIEELNEIFTDLSTIVAEQGTIIDNIEANVYNVANNTRDAATQLTKAARYQRSSRGRALCLLIILIVILTVILLGVSIRDRTITDQVSYGK